MNREVAVGRTPALLRARLPLPERLVVVTKVALALLLPLTGRWGHVFAYLLVAGWALRGPRQAIEALTLSWLLGFLNPGIYTLHPSAHVLRWLVLGAALVSVLFRPARAGGRLPKAWPSVAAFTAVALTLSLLVSYAKDVSVFKLLSFFAGTTAILAGFHLTRDEAGYWEHWFVTFFAVILVIGFPLIGHDLGYVRNGRAFQGLTNHPQAYGAFIAPFLAWIAGLGLQRRRPGWGLILLAGVGTVSLIATHARTGMLAAIGGLLLAITWSVLRGDFRRSVSTRRAAVVALGLALGVPTLLLAGGESAATRIADFVLKGDAETLDAAFYHSRGFLIELSLQNFRDSPLTGMGFGVASDPETLDVERLPVLGWPVGASVEKGFTITAVLEEIGLIGFGFFAAMLIALCMPLLKSRHALPSLALVFSALLVNFGEAVFFSVGGTGLLQWLLIGGARVMARGSEW